MPEAVPRHPELAQKYLGTAVPIGDNFYAAFNSVASALTEAEAEAEADAHTDRQCVMLPLT